MQDVELDGVELRVERRQDCRRHKDREKHNSGGQLDRHVARQPEPRCRSRSWQEPPVHDLAHRFRDRRVVGRGHHAKAYAGIEPRVQEVDDQVDDNVDERADEGEAEHRLEVQRCDGASDVIADAGPAEHRLGDHRAAQQQAIHEADGRHHRQQRIPERVADDDDARRQPL